MIDNADALRLCALGSNWVDAETFSALGQLYYGMLTKARREDGSVRHSRDAVGRWHSDGDDANTQSRVARALAAVITSELPIKIRLAAASWWSMLLSQAKNARTPASAGNWLIAIGRLRAADPGRDLSAAASLADWLVEDCYYAVRSNDWEWFETQWSPGSAAAATGLWYTYSALGESRYASVARTATSFLLTSRFHDRMFVPVGTIGGWRRGTAPAGVEQEPGEACAMVELLKAAAEIGRMPAAGEHIAIAAEWFTGNNTCGKSLTRGESGGCCSAIRRTGLDTNQNANALLAWLLTQAAIHTSTHSTHLAPAQAGEIFA